MALPLLLGIRLFLGLVFLTASLPKLAAPDDFRSALRNYQLLPFRLVRPVATWLPRFELVLAVALLIGIGTPATASLTAAALFLFSLAAGVNLARGRKIECGCFSSSSPREITWRLVVTDIALGAAATVVAVASPPMWVGRPTVAVFLVAACAVLTEQLVVEAMRLYRTLEHARAAASKEVAA